jgi:hypothetical protein
MFLEANQEVNIFLVQKMFKWLMVLFVNELPIDCEYMVWDLFFIKGSTVVFRLALTILQLMQESLLGQSVDDAILTLNDFCKGLSRKLLLRGLVSVSKLDVLKLRSVYRTQIIGDLQQEMQITTKRLFPNVYFLKKFLLYDALDNSQNNETKSWCCNQDWPVCLFDFTIKSRCPNFFIFKVKSPLTQFVVADYFFGEALTGTFEPKMASLDCLLAERSQHFCEDQQFVQYFKQKFELGDP